MREKIKISFSQITSCETKNLLNALDFIIDTALDCQEKLLNRQYETKKDVLLDLASIFNIQSLIPYQYSDFVDIVLLKVPSISQRLF